MSITDLSIPPINYGGGLNTTSNPMLIDDTEASDLQNVYFDEKGSLIKRNGYVKLNSLSVGAYPINGLYNYWKGTTSYGICSRNGALSAKTGAWYKMDALDGTWDEIGYGLSGTTTDRWSFDTFQDTLVGTNGVDVAYKWDGTTFAVLGGTPPRGKYVKLFKNFIIFANISNSTGKYAASTASSIIWADLATLETWTASQILQINDRDGDEITGLEVLWDRLIVFKNNSIVPVNYTGTASKASSGHYEDAFEVGTPIKVRGTISNQSIANIGNALIFKASDGVYLFNGVNVTCISDKIRPTIRTLGSAYLKNAVGVYYKKYNQYWLFCTSSSGTYNDLVFVLDVGTGSWTKYTGIEAAAAAIIEYPRGFEYLITGASQALGYTYKQDTGTIDHASTIDAYHISKWHDFGSADIEKRFRFLKFAIETESSGNITVTYYSDWGAVEGTQTISLTDEGGLLDEFQLDMDWLGGESRQERKAYLRGIVGTLLQVKIADNSSDPAFKILSMRPGFELKRVKASRGIGRSSRG